MRKLVVCVVTVGLLAASALTAQAVLLPVANPSFEEGPMFTGAAGDDVQGWGHPASHICGVTTATINGTQWDSLPSDGTSRVFFTNQDVNLDQQTNNFIQADQTYTLSADLGMIKTGQGFASITIEMWAYDFDASIFNVASETYTNVPGPSEFIAGGWIRGSASFIGDASHLGHAIFLRFFLNCSDGEPPYYQPYVDNVTLEEVPEPATLVMLGMGALAMLKRGRRR